MACVCWFVPQSGRPFVAHHSENCEFAYRGCHFTIGNWNAICSQAIATLAGLCYHGLLNNGDQRGIQNIQGALFILTTENTFPALYGTLGVFPMEWPVFIRESRSKLYSPSAYYFSKVLALVTNEKKVNRSLFFHANINSNVSQQLPGFVIETVVFITISYWLMGLRPDMSSFLYTCFILIVTCNTAAACGIVYIDVLIWYFTWVDWTFFLVWPFLQEHSSLLHLSRSPWL